MPPGPRVVTLVPSITETLLTWGVTPLACTRFCEQPQLPHVGGTKDPNLAAIVELRPDLVVMDAEENRRQDHDELVAAGIRVHATAIRSLADLDQQLPVLADLVGATWQPIGAPPSPPITRRAAVPIWKRPWMALGGPTYGTSLLRSLGVVEVTEDLGPYPEVPLEELAALAPDLVVAPDEPYPFGERHRAELEQVAPVVFVDGRDLLWWGERTRSARERLSEILAS